MSQQLWAWVGDADRRAVEENSPDNLGPIGAACREFSYERVHLLLNRNDEQDKAYPSWLEKTCRVKTERHTLKLEDPTDLKTIYEKVRDALNGAPADRPRHYHLSPGTPAMAVAWILLAKGLHPATLIQSHRQSGARTVAFPFDLYSEFLPDALRQRHAELERGEAQRQAAHPNFEKVLGQSKGIREAKARAALFARTGVPMLLLGASGTGKELFARAIHETHRPAGPFQVINCGAIPENLIESELFGHARGAFTGAARDHKGAFERAHGGTLFLDEIGEMPPALQVRLLRVLQEGEIHPVGADKVRKVDVRILAATHRDLEDLVRQDRFRLDLYFRLAVGVIRIPSLAERGAHDIRQLAEHFLDHFNAIHGRENPDFVPRAFSPGARRLLAGHPWPGNIRELENTIHRALLLASGPSITEGELRAELLTLAAASRGPFTDKPISGGQFRLDDEIDALRRHYITKAFRATRGHLKKSAEALGYNHYQTLQNQAEKLGIPREDFEN